MPASWENEIPRIVNGWSSPNPKRWTAGIWRAPLPNTSAWSKTRNPTIRAKAIVARAR